MSTRLASVAGSLVEVVVAVVVVVVLLAVAVVLAEVVVIERPSEARGCSS